MFLTYRLMANTLSDLFLVLDFLSITEESAVKSEMIEVLSTC